MINKIFLMLTAIVLSACSNIPLIGSGSSQDSTSAPAATTPAPRGGSTRQPEQISGKGINLVGDCKQKEIDGFEENAQVVVKGGRMLNLTWRMRLGRKGTCSFDGEDFRQTRDTPSIELVAKDGSGCRLLMWADGRSHRVTLAHNNCANFCTRGVYDKAWPVMFDPRTGGCANNN
ncbi:MAG: hypothetical protein WA888_22045 [Burkholderiaceae bacterium]